jgi:AcrR family transcriptional regulator
MTPRNKELNEQMRKEAMSKITKAALKVFAEYGYHGATMNQIKQASGLSKGLVYHYFASKEKIFFHLVETALKISRSIWLEALKPPGTAWQKIERISKALVEHAFSDDNSLYFLIMMQALTQGKSIPGLLEYIIENSSHYNELPKLIVEAQMSGDVVLGDPEVLTNSYFALFQGYTLILLHDKELKKRLTSETFLRILRK